jgi:tetratricopeptide (TPR) repeat protein
VIGVACAMLSAVPPQVPASDNPDELYRHREDLASATRAAEVWATRAGADYEAAWKLSRVCYWLGAHLPERSRRSALERGIAAGETAVRLGPDRPEGHFWLAADMGALAESAGLMQGIKYRGRIRDELQRSIAIDPAWEGGSAEAALGEWYYEVPRMFGGSGSKAEAHLRRALTYDPQNLEALSVLADLLGSTGHRDEARALLQRVLDAPVSTDWAPEDREYKKKAAERLKALGGT